MLMDIIAAEQKDFIKIASLLDVIHKEQKQGFDLQYRLIYTGHHNDLLTNDLFAQLHIPKPHINLEIKSRASGTEYTATIMVRYEKALKMAKPDIILVVSNSDAAMACALTAKKTFSIRVGHIDAGICVPIKSAANAINQIVADSLTDYYFTATHSANAHLRTAGVAEEDIFFVGSMQADALLKIREQFTQPDIWQEQQLQHDGYIIVDLQSRNNLTTSTLKTIVTAIINSTDVPVIFTTTAENVETIGKSLQLQNLFFIQYPDFFQQMYLLQHAMLVVTDDGDIQETTTILQIPCLTIGNSVERLETYSIGTNILVTPTYHAITTTLEKLYDNKWKKGKTPYLWDGKAAQRMVAVLKNLL